LCVTRRDIEQKTASQRIRKEETANSKESVTVVEKLDTRKLIAGIKLKIRTRNQPGTSLKVKLELQWWTRPRMKVDLWWNF